MNQCTCKIEWDAEQFWHIEYCPMHKSAPELLEACTLALPFLEEYRERVIKGEIGGKLLTGDYAPVNDLRRAIAAAEGRE